MVVDYPKDMPVGPSIREKARFAGYFLKLQGYESGVAKPGQRPETAPLLIGRLEWEPTMAAIQPDNTQELKWGAAAVAVIAAAWLLQFLYFKRRRKKVAAPQPKFDPATGEPISIDTWLERSSRHASRAGDAAESENDYIAGEDNPGGYPNPDVPWYPDRSGRG